jgi:hypothetical protein
MGLLPSYSQSDSNENGWHLGSITLNTGQAFSGKVRYDQLTELVQLRTETMLKAFSARQVQSFRFSEQAYGMLREFITVDFHPSARYARKTFFEVVLKGPLMVLRQPHHLNNRSLAQNHPSDNSLALFDYLTGFSYYVYTQNEFVAIRNFKKAILPLMIKDFGRELAQIVKDKKLRIFRLDSQIRLINYYNFLKNPLSTTASLSTTDLAD